MAIESILLIGVVAVFAGAAPLILYFRHRLNREEARTGAAKALMQDGPIGMIRKTETGWEANTLAQRLLFSRPIDPVSDADLIGVVAPSLRDAFRESLAALTGEERDFDLTVDTYTDVRVIAVSGRTVAGQAVLWLRDESASAWLAEQYSERETELAELRAVVDALPLPVWWRDANTLALKGNNSAYRQMIGSSDGSDESRTPAKRTMTDRSKDLARLVARTGMAQTESRHAVIEGNRLALDITESPLEKYPGLLVGHARDMTPLETLQMTLAEHISIQDQVLERLNSAIVIFGPDKRLMFFNRAYADLWRMPPDFLEDQPAIGTLLEYQRELRLLPETSDFPAFKRSMERRFTDLIEAKDDLLHLPDGRTLQAICSPHPLGGLIFQYEDVTDRLALESSHNTLSAVQRSTLNSLFEGVCVFGRDGRLKLFNNVYADLFNLNPSWLATEPHVSEVTEAARPVLPETDDWPTLKRRLVHSVSEPKVRHGRMSLANDRVIDYAYVPLPDSQCLVLYFDVTDSTRVEAALRERNRALENADLLKSRFVANVSYELRTPLNAILGFTELMQIGRFGPLSDSQASCVADIFSAAQSLSELIGDILDLAAVQAGFMEIDSQPVDIAESLAETVEAMGRRKPLPSAIHLDRPDGTVGVAADPRRLAQALRNMLVDGMHYAPNGSDIHVHLTGADRDGRVTLKVSVPKRRPDDAPWSDRLLGNQSIPDIDSGLANSTDVGITLARSLLAVQDVDVRPGSEPDSLICTFAKADV